MECWRLRTGEAPPEARPFALIVDGPHGQIIHAVTSAARGSAIRPGQRVTDARAICPDLVLESHDERAGVHALTRLGTWSGRWSPLVAVDGPDGLLIDLTGAAHLWGGEGETARAILADLKRLGHVARLAIAPTVGAAWALARHGDARCTRVDPIDADDALARLPIQGLRLDADTILLLRRLGLKTIGALATVPRVPLARRFTESDPSRNPLLRLDQATGRLAEPVIPHVAEPPIRVQRRVTEPVTDLAVLRILLAGMSGDLVQLLGKRGHGLRGVRLDAYRVDGGVEWTQVETACATRDAHHVRRLFDDRLDKLDAGFGFDAFTLTAFRTESLGAAQSGLLSDEPGELMVTRLIDRLVAKFGCANVRRPVAIDSHVPERCVRWTSALEPLAPPGARPTATRPLRLLDRPERIEVLYATPEGAPRRFTWRKRIHLIAKVQGPERIAPEWWRARPGARERDYYRIEDEQGRRYWLFRHGRFGDDQDTEPGWYMHGLFA